MAYHRIQFSTEELAILLDAISNYQPTNRDDYIEVSSIHKKVRKVLMLANAGLTANGNLLPQGKSRYFEAKDQELADSDYERITGKKFEFVCNGSVSRMEELMDKGKTGTLTAEEEQEFLKLNGWG